MMPKFFSDPDALAEEIIREVGTDLVVGLPLGLGKANHVINALYARAYADPYIELTLLSALTLEKPKPKALIERRFITPMIDRLFGRYPDLPYADALRQNRLPPNINVVEFFFLVGRWLQPTSSAPCWTARRPIFPCLRRRPSRSPIPNTPSA
jgi:hypothetical protein